MAWVPSESAVEELMPRLLPVEPCDLAEGFDPSVPPRTPQEYLRRVQIEAAQCPDVVVAQIDPKKLKRKQSVNVSLSGCQPAPEGYSPTLKWQQQQVAQFSTVRQSVNKHRSHWKSQQLDSNVTMPKSEDEEGWKKFCLGERLCAEGAIGPATNESPGIDYVQIGFPPLLSIVSRMNQATVTSVLEYLSNWFGERDFTPELDSKDDERVPALNLLICLVSSFWRTQHLCLYVVLRTEPGPHACQASALLLEPHPQPYDF
ncbi:gem-associated protein 2 isoform X6 [Marmota flaviventris]|uniref:gem-associated protein 2 isoform X6 n=1 Tax=Marmota flaviventris TaxID=93162 RepID=UPI003A87052A